MTDSARSFPSSEVFVPTSSKPAGSSNNSSSRGSEYLVDDHVALVNNTAERYAAPRTGSEPAAPLPAPNTLSSARIPAVTSSSRYTVLDHQSLSGPNSNLASASPPPASAEGFQIRGRGAGGPGGPSVYGSTGNVYLHEGGFWRTTPIAAVPNVPNTDFRQNTTSALRGVTTLAPTSPTPLDVLSASQQQRLQSSGSGSNSGSYTRLVAEQPVMPMKLRSTDLEHTTQQQIVALQQAAEERVQNKVDLTVLANQVAKLTAENEQLRKQNHELTASVDLMQQITDEKQQTSLILKDYYIDQQRKFSEATAIEYEVKLALESVNHEVRYRRMEIAQQEYHERSLIELQRMYDYELKVATGTCDAARARIRGLEAELAQFRGSSGALTADIASLKEKLAQANETIHFRDRIISSNQQKLDSLQGTLGQSLSTDPFFKAQVEQRLEAMGVKQSSSPAKLASAETVPAVLKSIVEEANATLIRLRAILRVHRRSERDWDQMNADRLLDLTRDTMMAMQEDLAAYRTFVIEMAAHASTLSPNPEENLAPLDPSLCAYGIPSDGPLQPHLSNLSHLILSGTGGVPHSTVSKSVAMTHSNAQRETLQIVLSLCDTGLSQFYSLQPALQQLPSGARNLSEQLLQTLVATQRVLAASGGLSSAPQAPAFKSVASSSPVSFRSTGTPSTTSVISGPTLIASSIATTDSVRKGGSSSRSVSPPQSRVINVNAAAPAAYGSASTTSQLQTGVKTGVPRFVSKSPTANLVSTSGGIYSATTTTTASPASSSVLISGGAPQGRAAVTTINDRGIAEDPSALASSPFTDVRASRAPRSRAKSPTSSSIRTVSSEGRRTPEAKSATNRPITIRRARSPTAAERFQRLPAQPTLWSTEMESSPPKPSQGEPTASGRPAWKS